MLPTSPAAWLPFAAIADHNSKGGSGVAIAATTNNGRWVHRPTVHNKTFLHCASTFRLFSTVHRLTVHNKGPASPFPLLSARHLLLLPGTPSREVTSVYKVNQGGRMLHAQNYPLDNGCYTSKMGFKSLWKMYMHTNLRFKLGMAALF